MFPELDIKHLQDIPGYKAILKSVLKCQIQLLVEQLSEHTQEESVIITASVTDGSLYQLGSNTGKTFLDGKDEIKSQFLGHCLKNYHSKSTAKSDGQTDRSVDRDESSNRYSAFYNDQGDPVPVKITRVGTGSEERIPLNSASTRMGSYHQNLEFGRKRPIPGPSNSRRKSNVGNRYSRQPGSRMMTYPNPGEISRTDAQILSESSTFSLPQQQSENTSDQTSDFQREMINSTASLSHSFDQSSKVNVKQERKSNFEGGSNINLDSPSHQQSLEDHHNEMSSPGNRAATSTDQDGSHTVENSRTANTERGVESGVDNSHDTQDQYPPDLQTEGETSLQKEKCNNGTVKVEPISESDLELEITGIEVGATPTSGFNWATQGSLDYSALSSAGYQGSEQHEDLTNYQRQHSDLGTSEHVNLNQSPVEGQTDLAAGSVMHFVKENLISDTSETHVCGMCGNHFKSAQFLADHQLNHAKERPHQCDICLKRFIRLSTMRIHRRLHTGEKPYVCNLCGIGFHRQDRLVYHQHSHTHSS